MGFWFFMLFQLLLIPVLMIVSGCMMQKHHTRKPNSLLGYRTMLSTKNEQTWKFSNELCGRLYEKLGRLALVLSVLLMLALPGKGDDAVSRAGTVLALLQCILLILPIFPVQRALRKNFDENGNPRT